MHCHLDPLPGKQDRLVFGVNRQNESFIRPFNLQPTPAGSSAKLCPSVTRVPWRIQGGLLLIIKHFSCGSGQRHSASYF